MTGNAAAVERRDHAVLRCAVDAGASSLRCDVMQGMTAHCLSVCCIAVLHSIRVGGCVPGQL